MPRNKRIRQSHTHPNITYTTRLRNRAELFARGSISASLSAHFLPYDAHFGISRALANHHHRVRGETNQSQNQRPSDPLLHESLYISSPASWRRCDVGIYSICGIDAARGASIQKSKIVNLADNTFIPIERECGTQHHHPLVQRIYFTPATSHTSIQQKMSECFVNGA